MPNFQNSSQGNILEILATILEIQELDMQMIQLMRLKKERQRELENINAIKGDLTHQVKAKEDEIIELKTIIKISEEELGELQNHIKELENKQSSIKKVDEFNALSHEMSASDKQRTLKEQSLSDLYDKLTNEEDHLKNFRESLESTTESSKVLENEIFERISAINKEGKVIKEQRDELVKQADPEVFRIYERLLNNKKDRVIVPIENRTCSGCHIQLTPQDENLVRKAERITFCEHCSRILYWAETNDPEAQTGTRVRRRRTTKQTA